MKEPTSSQLVRLGIVLSIVFASVLPLSGVAAAHDELTRTSPANGATLGTPPTYVEFEFDAAVKPSFATVVITGPDGQRWDTGGAAVSGLVVQAAVKDAAPPGAYTAAYRVVSSDSHPITGSIKYTVMTSADTSTQTAPPMTSSAPPPAIAQIAPTENNVAQNNVAQNDVAEDDVTLWPWLPGAFLLAVAALAVIRRSRREDG